MVVVRLEHLVVQGLAVVRLSSGVEQQSGQGQSVLMRRLVGPVLATAEGARQAGERRGEPFPQKARVGIGTGPEEQLGARQAGPGGWFIGQPAEAQIEQGRPAVRTPDGCDHGRTPIEEPFECCDGSGHGGRVRVRGGELRVGREKCRGTDWAGPIVRAVGQTGQPDQLVGRVALGGYPVRVAAPPPDQAEVLAQRRPTREVVVTGDAQLRVRQPQSCGSLSQLGTSRMQPPEEGYRLGITGSRLP